MKSRLPIVESLSTVGLDPASDRDDWDALLTEQRRYVVGQIPAGHQPVGDLRWQVAEDCDEPVPTGQTHYRFLLQHTR